MKSKERHEIKENELAEIFKKVVYFFEDYKKETIYAGIAVLGIILIYIGAWAYNSYKVSVQNKSFNEEINLLKEGSKNKEKILKLAKKGGVATFGVFALAEEHLRRGEYKEALELIKEVKKSSGMINYLKAEAIKIQVNYAKKEYDKIINLYRGKLKTLLKENKEFPADLILFYVANSYESKGDTDSARKIFEEIRTNFPYSSYGISAAKKLVSLR